MGNSPSSEPVGLDHVRVLFCSSGNFQYAFDQCSRLLKDEIAQGKVTLIDCAPENIEIESEKAHVIIPFMAKINKGILVRAEECSLVMQVGHSVRF